MRVIGSAIFMLSLRHVTILKYLHGPPSSSSLESHPKVNSFARFLGLEPLASERGVASVGDPANCFHGSWCKENCDANNLEEFKGVMRGKRCGLQCY